MSNNNFVAQIDESLCIGCTLCIKACPFDAIIGANNFMHTVLVTECPGCKLCIPACPVDCIELIVTKIRKTNNEFKKQAKTHILRDQARQQDKASTFEYQKKNLLEDKKNVINDLIKRVNKN
tara:strand:- start:1397 stop:1762 length:366 start_codon:yes stop_codon:yes gene_type:complete